MIFSLCWWDFSIVQRTFLRLMIHVDNSILLLYHVFAMYNNSCRSSEHIVDWCMWSTWLVCVTEERYVWRTRVRTKRKLMFSLCWWDFPIVQRTFRRFLLYIDNSILSLCFVFGMCNISFSSSERVVEGGSVWLLAFVLDREVVGVNKCLIQLILSARTERRMTNELKNKKKNDVLCVLMGLFYYSEDFSWASDIYI